MIRRRRIMVYGSFPGSQQQEVDKVLSELVEVGLRNTFAFITRNGAKPGGTSTWPGASPGTVPVDNIIIQSVSQFCAPKDVRKRLTTYVSPDRTEFVDIGQTTFACPERRFEMYSLLLKKADCFIFIGGSDGVLRLGLLCHFLRKPFLIVNKYGTGASELAGSLYGAESYYQNLAEDDRLMLGSPGLTGSDLYRLACRSMRSPVLFAFLETCRGEMNLAHALGIAGRRLHHHLATIGRIVVVLLAILFTLQMVKIEAGVTLKHIQEGFAHGIEFLREILPEPSESAPMRAK